MGASDVHISEGNPILFRVNTDLVPASKGPVSGKLATDLIKEVTGTDGWKRFEEEREYDSSYAVEDEFRVRINCHFERGFPSLVGRLIPDSVPTMEEAGLVGEVDQFCHLHDGLILFTGPTGAGKSTSMAAMIQHIREMRSVNVITLEDPIEFLFDKETQGIIRQRQMGEDFLSFPEALRHVLRQDPDVVMVGEMRDHETIAAALTLAETGHLVFGTLHTPNAIQTIDRILDVFEPYQQPQIRSQLSLSLKLVVAQRLLPKEGGGMVALREILVNNPAVANIIRESRIQELVSVLQMSRSDGMMTFEKYAEKLVKDGDITQETYDYTMGILESEREDNKRK